MRWKSCKKRMLKKLSLKKWQENGVFDFYCCLHDKICGEIFWLLLALFANFKAKIGRKGSKNEKCIWKNVSHNPIFNLSPVWEAPFCQKKSKSLYPSKHTNVHWYSVHSSNNDYLCCRLFSNDNPGEPILYTVIILCVPYKL